MDNDSITIDVNRVVAERINRLLMHQQHITKTTVEDLIVRALHGYLDEWENALLCCPRCNRE